VTPASDAGASDHPKFNSIATASPGRDQPTMIAAALQDPLVAILALLVVGVTASRVLFRRHPLGRAIVRVVFLLLLTFALLYAGIVPYRPSQPTGVPLRDAVHAVLRVAWWLWAAWFLVGVIRAFISVEHRPHEGRLLQDLLAGAVYLAALFAIVAYVLDLPVQGLLATSGVIAIILGLALQSTLGDVFSGIVLNFSRPYRPGDWISIDGTTEGRVIEMNWRATHILTGRRDLAILPNSSIAKSKIVNVSSPAGTHGAAITVAIDGAVPPSAGMEVLQEAIVNCLAIVTVPAPSVAINAISASATEFVITFFAADLAATVRAQNELLDVVYRHLAAAGINLAAGPNAVPRVRETRTRPERVLDLAEIFVSLTPVERAAIAEKLQARAYETGDTLLAPGTVLQSLCVVASGVVSARRDNGEIEEEMVRLGPGEHFGEISLLTGAATPVHLVALTPSVVYELAKAEFTVVLDAHPEVSQALKRSLARRQTAISPPAQSDGDEIVPQRLRSRLSNWLQRRYDATVSE
jgi:small-conductance mechanosensitive channel/CRP-like cAMP-binding protein